MNDTHTSLASFAFGVPESILFRALRALPAGAWVEVGTDATSSVPDADFRRAGWRMIRLDADASASLSDALAGIADTQVHWMAVHDGALARIANWHAGAWRPLVVLAKPAALALAGVPQPAWQTALARNGYVFAVADDDHAYFVRDDQPAIHADIAQLACENWRTKLQASHHAHLQAVHAEKQARKAVLQTQMQADAAQTEAQALRLQLAAVYASNSWKSTTPLRWGARLSRQPRSALRELVVLGVRVLRRILRRVIAKAAAHHGLRRWCATLEQRHPTLLRRVKAMLGPVPVQPHVVIAAELPAIDPNNIVGPQFKTLLLDELDRCMPPASR